MRHDIEAIANKVQGGALRALLSMTGEYQFPGKATFNANGAFALHWVSGVGGSGSLCETTALRDGKWNRAAYRLTPLGLQVQAFLTQPHHK